MATTTLIWTALPQSLQAFRDVVTLSLSAFISPRLVTTNTLPGLLSDFPLYDDPWPETASGLSIRATLLDPVSGASQAYPARIVNSGTEALSPAVWNLLFPPTTPVNPFGYTSLSNQRVQSYPVGQTLQFLEDLYRSVAISDPTAPHPIAGNDLLYRAIGRIRHHARADRSASPADVVDRIAKEVVELSDGSRVEDHRDDLEALTAAYQFFARDRGLPDDFSTPDPVSRWDPDFHQMVAALGDAPILLRRLGFVLDLEVSIPLDAFLASGEIYLAPALDAVILEQPRTRFVARLPSDPLGAAFAPESITQDISEGHLDMNRDDYHLYQMDVDGSALKLVNHTANVYQHSEAFTQHFSRPADEVSTLPYPVSAGLAVARDERASRVEDAFYSQDAINDELGGGDLSKVPLYWEDVLRGYRVDVNDGTRWRSLCARLVEYVAGGRPQGLFEDEGYVKRASASHDEHETDRMYLHEQLFEWGGWSLVAARPGLVLNPEETLQPRSNPPATALDLETTVEPQPGSLPRLRFNNTYRLKARAVDLAGNSVDLNHPGGDQRSTVERTYRRYEPLPQPVLVYRDPITEGEWIENLVIRSDRGVTVAAYAEAHGYNETCERHVAPPKAHLFLCEQHGIFDSKWATEGPTHEQSYAMAAKEGGTFLDEQVWESAGQAYKSVTLSFWSHPDTPINDPRAQRGDPLGEGVYVTHPDPVAVLPYLPDPSAQGVVLHQPSTGAAWVKEFTSAATYDATWPELPPFRLVCETETSSTAPVISTVGATFDVRLPPATIFECEIGSQMLAGRRSHYQLWAEIQGNAVAVGAANNHLHSLLAPRRKITFVHAVQRPLEDPISSVIGDSFKDEGQTWSVLRGDIAVHGRSASQLDVLAVWSEIIDDVNDPTGPKWITRTAHVGQVEVAYDDTAVVFPGQTEDLGFTTKRIVKHEHGDTKHRRVKYYGKATTRYREYFPETIWRIEENIIALEDPAATAPTFVFCTSRPVAPALRMMVPAMRWETSPDGLTVTRHGNVLRVYLDRPWFTTGEDEYLGVLFGRSANDVRTEWAADPVRRRDAPTNPMTTASVLNPTASLTMADHEGTAVDVLMFEVQYDPDQGLHYADIEIASEDAYTPFVRLVVARVQPFAVIEGGLDLRVSESLRTEWIQPVPSREITVERTGANEVHVTVKGVASGDVAALPSRQTFRLDEGRASRHSVCARVEWNERGVSDLAWEPTLSRPALLRPYRLGNDAVNTYWRGFATVSGTVPGGPDLPTNGGPAWRLSVYEIELYPSDVDTQGPVSGFTVHPPTVGDRADYEDDTGASGRVVMVAHLPIPA